MEFDHLEKSVKRSQLVAELARRVVAVKLPHPTRVAIDGVDAAGKTTLADELVSFIQAYERTVIRVSIDGFHNPAAIRHRRGPTSPEGYYYDSFNYPALRDALLVPLGPGGTLRYRSSVFDYRTDSETSAELLTTESDAVLLFDGVFLLRPELRDYWDFTIFVEAAFEVTLARAMRRDVALFGDAASVKMRYEKRYIPGQKIYLEQCQPKQRANAVVDNNVTEKPFLTRLQD